MARPPLSQKPQKQPRLPLLAAAAALALCGFLTRPAAAQDFYEQQLAAGRTDYSSGRMVKANDELRIAAFGFLDRPALLSEALVHLALAESSLGLTADLTRTFERFLEVERRFGQYGTLTLDPAVRTTFEALLVKTVGPAAVSATPSVAHLIESEDQKIARMPPRERIRALESAASKHATEIRWPLWLAREFASTEDWRSAARWSGRALEIDRASVEARTMLARARTARGECSEALSALTGLSADDFNRHPDSYADQTVCFAQQKRWTEARASLARVPEKLRVRADVRSAAENIARASTPSGPDRRTTAAPPASSPRPVETSRPARSGDESGGKTMTSAPSTSSASGPLTTTQAAAPLRSTATPAQTPATASTTTPGKSLNAGSPSTAQSQAGVQTSTAAPPPPASSVSSRPAATTTSAATATAPSTSSVKSPASTGSTSQKATPPQPGTNPPSSSTTVASRPAVPAAVDAGRAQRSAQTLDQARRMVRESHYREAEQTLQAALALDPSSRALRLALLEAAILARDYPTAATQTSSLSPLVAGESSGCFMRLLQCTRPGNTMRLAV